MRMSIGCVIWEHIKNMLTSYFDYSKDVAECDDFLPRGDIKVSSSLGQGRDTLVLRPILR